MTPILIFGKNGQVSSALSAQLKNNAIALSHQDADFTKPNTVLAQLKKHRPQAVINAAAYTHVDKAEKEQDIAQKINADTPGLIAQYCHDEHIPFIHYSTDYVFSGTGTKPWTETDPTDPVNVYGKTKLAGEQNITAIGGTYLIFRTSWVYDTHHHNFLTKIINLAKQHETLSIVNDQIGTPCHAQELATATLQALKKATPEISGIYHLTQKESTSWYDFAKCFLTYAKNNGIKLLMNELKPIPSSAFPTTAKRPLNSRLDCSKAKTVLDIHLPHWQHSLLTHMERYCADPKHQA